GSTKFLLFFKQRFFHYKSLISFMKSVTTAFPPPYRGRSGQPRSVFVRFAIRSPRPCRSDLFSEAPAAISTFRRGFSDSRYSRSPASPETAIPPVARPLAPPVGQSPVVWGLDRSRTSWLDA